MNAACMPLCFGSPWLDSFLVQPVCNFLEAKAFFAPAFHSAKNLLFVRLLAEDALDTLETIGYESQRVALLLLIVQSRGNPLGNEFPLHLGHSSHDGEKELSHSAAGVDFFGNGEKACVAFLENILDEIEKVTGIAGKPIKFVDNDGVRFFALDPIEELLKTRSLKILA